MECNLKWGDIINQNYDITDDNSIVLSGITNTKLVFDGIVCDVSGSGNNKTSNNMSVEYLNKMKAILKNYKTERKKFMIHYESAKNECIKEIEFSMKYEGAQVFDPVTGVHNICFVLDVSSMYPSVIIGFNLSHNTLIKDKDMLKYPHKEYTYKLRYGKEIKCAFVDESVEKSLISSVLIKVNSQRSEAKKQLKIAYGTPMYSTWSSLEQSLKIIANSLYGTLGSYYTKLSEPCIAAITTKKGKEFIKYAAVKATKIVNETISDMMIKKGLVVPFDSMNYSPIIYGDTDSIFIKIHDQGYLNGQLVPLFDSEKDKIDFIMKGFGDKLAETITKDYGVYSMKIVLEKAIKQLVLLTKKRYSGKIIMKEEDKIDYEGKRKDAGNVLKRRDSVLVAKYICGAVIDKIMEGISNTDAIKFVELTLEKIARGEYKDNCYIKSQSFKGIEKYDPKRKLPHVEVAKKLTEKFPEFAPQSNARIEYLFKYISTKITKQGYIKKEQYKPYEMACHLCEFKDADEIDYGYYIRACIGKPLKEILMKIFKIEGEAIDDMIDKYSYYYGPNAVEKDIGYNSKNKKQKDISVDLKEIEAKTEAILEEDYETDL
jgi:DNA polymerase elongation subunit (family B)